MSTSPFFRLTDNESGRGFASIEAEQAAQAATDTAMAQLGCVPVFCEVCGLRLYALADSAGPHLCGAVQCSPLAFAPMR